jgi:hypothetical protein
MSSPGKRRSVLQFIFGDAIGEMLGVMLGIILMLVLFMGWPYLIIYLSKSASNSSSKVLEQVPSDTRSILEELATVQSKTQGLIAKLQGDIQKSENLLAQKKSALEELQRQIDILKLTPEQLAVIESYNKSVTHDPAFVEWITRKSTWYEIGAAFVVAFFFYRLGVRSGKKHGESE